MTYKSITIVIPVFNEVNFLEQILERVEAVDFCGLETEIILVDDASTDGTTEIFKRLEQDPANKYGIYYHEKNQGKGAALRTGFAHAKGDLIAIQDADLEYDPKDYPELVQLILDGKADVVYGSRLSDGKSDGAFKLSNYLGNKFLTLLTNVLYGTTLTDMETCYKVFRADILKSITIRSNRFDFEPEITAKVLKKKVNIVETPITYSGRDFSEGKKITWRDGIAAMWTLFKYRFVD